MVLVDSSFESYRECVEGGLPSHRPACVAAAGGVQRPGGEVEALQRGLVVREVPSRADSAAIAGVERLDRVCAADHAPDLDVVVEERYELAPGVLPELADRRVLLAPLRVELHKTLSRDGL